MPCNSEHMEPSYDETYSKRACKHICYVFNALSLDIPTWVERGSKDCYGCPSRLVEAEQLLYKTIQKMSTKEFESIVYTAKSKRARALANWYEDYDETLKDEQRRKALEKAHEKRAKSLLSKYRKEEVEIIKNYLGGKA